MKKSILITILITITMLVCLLVFNQKEFTINKSQKLQITTTLFPLYDFTNEIGREKINVSLLLPPGVEAHNFEPKPSDLLKINETGLFIYTGKFMEPWVENLIKGINIDKTKVVNVSTNISLIHNNDPHIWLDFDNDKKIIKTITTALSNKDQTNAKFYQQRAKEYIDKLTALDTKYKTTLSNCKSKEIVYGGHYAFGYLTNRYNLKYVTAQGVSPDSEPTANDLIQLIKQIKKNNIKYVFYEELTSPKIAETIAKETDTKLLLLSAAHNVSKNDLINRKSFLDIMEKNLKNLEIGLECKK